MKKVLLGLTVSLTLTVAQGQTTVYHPFPDSNAHWTEVAWWITGNPPCPVNDSYTLFLWGDTVISATLYHKIYKSGYISSTCPPPGGYNYYNDYKGALRQDSLQKKVFFVPATNTSEILLYDFNLNVGYTLPLSYNNISFNYVSSIDSVLVGTKYHKRFLLNNLNDTSYALIEGVGSTFGLYNPMDIFVESGGQLNCFQHNVQSYPTTFNCPFAVGISETPNQTISISFFPNPFSTQTALRTNTPLINATLTVDNCFAQTVAQIKNISGQAITFSRGNLASRVYFVRLTDDSKIISTDKLVITD